MDCGGEIGVLEKWLVLRNSPRSKRARFDCAKEARARSIPCFLAWLRYVLATIMQHSDGEIILTSLTRTIAEVTPINLPLDRQTLCTAGDVLAPCVQTSTQ
jgi:hypothetical protein